MARMLTIALMIYSQIEKTLNGFKTGCKLPSHVINEKVAVVLRVLEVLIRSV